MNITKEGEEQKPLSMLDLEYLRWYARYMSKEQLFDRYGGYLTKDELEGYYKLIEEQQKINGKS
jgi:hypothetical protein